MENAAQTSSNQVALPDAVILQSTMQRQLLSCRRLAAIVADPELALRLSELADDTEAQALVGFLTLNAGGNPATNLARRARSAVNQGIVTQ